MFAGQTGWRGVEHGRARSHPRVHAGGVGHSAAMLFLKLLLSGLYKLPPVSGVMLYRGVKREVLGRFCEGDEKTWWAVHGRAAAHSPHAGL